MVMGELGVVIPDVVEPILAHRAFLTAGRHLHSTQPWGVNWPIGTQVHAECRHYEGDLVYDVGDGCDHTPSPNARKHTGYGCGIYAFNSLERLAREFGSGQYVLGQVLLSGEVWPHANGYRAQRAQISAIYDTGKITERVYAEFYGVPLVKVDPRQLDTWYRDWDMEKKANQAKSMRRAGVSSAKTTDFITALDVATCMAYVLGGFVQVAAKKAVDVLHVQTLNALKNVRSKFNG